MKETEEYFAYLANRAKEYEQVRRQILKYILRNKINSSEIATDLFIIGFLWKAYQRNETLRETDIAMLLGAEEDDEFVSEVNPIDDYVLDSEEVKMDFEELLDKVVSNYK